MKPKIKTFYAKTPEAIDSKINEFFATDDRTILSITPIIQTVGNEVMFFYVIRYEELTRQNVLKHSLKEMFK